MDLAVFEKDAREEMDMDSTGKDLIYFKNVKLSLDKKELTMEHHWGKDDQSEQTNVMKVIIVQKGSSSRGKKSPSPAPAPSPEPDSKPGVSIPCYVPHNLNAHLSLSPCSPE